ncbi:MAG: type I-C CRISPR-associated protein Cas8c/Csd1 [Flavobacteriales bacterium]|nr:type I-C CRISPR-associated protein Cas8c/Csd1 [Flavobacteriales bacterium]
MILQALNDYYKRAENLAPEGWVRRGVDYLIVLDKQGNCTNVECIQDQVKGKAIAHQMLVPHIGKQALKHTNSGKDANLLWDNGSFVLGGAGKGRTKVESFVATLDEWFPGTQDEGVSAIRSFTRLMLERPGSRDELLTRFNLKELFDERDFVFAFKLHGDVEPVHNRRAVRTAYEQKRTNGTSERQVMGNCLVTGAENVPLALNETVIKPILGGQPAGVNIISFNKRSFESYGKAGRKGENAPVSKEASFGYTTALNGLLTSDHQRLQIADATTVFWASEQHEMEDLFGEIMVDDPERGTKALQAMLNAARSGRFTIGEPTATFHVLGVAAPAKARVSIRFYQEAESLALAKRLLQHFEDLQVTETPIHYSISRLLRSIAVRGEKENIPDGLASDLVRCIVGDLPYPPVLLSAAVMRCRAEQSKRDKKRGSENVPRERAALLKACLNRTIRLNNQTANEPQPEFTAMLDPNNPDNAYRLGRLFAALEKTQEDAFWPTRLNATIRDRYYGAASSTPATVFSTLLRMKNHHISKMENRGTAINREKLIGEIMDGLDKFPGHLPLPAQARFALGYYHQRQALFPNSDKSNEPSNN